jgi:hypothetical protein
LVGLIAFLGGVGVGVVGTIFQPPLVIFAAVALAVTALWKARVVADHRPPKSVYVLAAGALGMALAFIALVLPVLL